MRPPALRGRMGLYSEGNRGGMRWASEIAAKLALWLFCALCVAAAVLLAFRQGLAAFEYSFPESIEIPQSLDPANSDYVKAEGDWLFRALIPPQSAAAKARYRQALALNPFYYNHWIDWAEANWRQGDDSPAEDALRMALRLAPNRHEALRIYGDFLLEKDLKKASFYHAACIQLQPGAARAIWPVYWALGWPATQTALALLGQNPKLHQDHFREALAWIDPDEAHSLWQALSSIPQALDPPSYNAYFSYLIRHRNYEDARSLWSEIAARHYGDLPGYKSNENALFWNGDFELPLRFAGGLEWQLPNSPPKGSVIAISAARAANQDRSLWLHFDGKENVSGVLARHFFFVQPEQAYRLEFHVNALGITTSNGPFVEVAVSGLQTERVRSEAAVGTGDWLQGLSFRAPADGHWAELTVQRQRSSKLDNKILGDAWYDDFVLEIVDTPLPDDAP